MSAGVMDYAKRVTYRPEERVTLLRSLSVAEQSTVLLSVSPYIQQKVLEQFTNQEIVDVLDYMDLQSAQRLVTRIRDEKRREKIISRLKAEIKDKMDFFLRFHPKASFSLVHFNYVYVSSSTTIGEAGDIIEDHYDETGKFPEILVHDDGVLVGEVPIGVLVRERNNLALEKFIQPVTTITYQAEVNDILETFASSGKKKVVVLDHDGSVLGIIYADDALELFGDKLSESLYSFVGVDSSERPHDSSFKKFKNRSPWLVVNLATSFLAAGVILFFQDTMNALTFLSIYIPVVSGMGGNAASQTFAVTMRGITLGSVSLKEGGAIIKNELLAGLMNGFVIGSIVSLISLIVGQSFWLGLVVAMSMIGVHLVAAFFATIIPLLLKNLGLDPATKSMIFISTTTDVFGLLFLLGFGTWLLL